MSGLLFDSLHQGLGKVIELRVQKHEVVASNLANIDTPNFRGVSVDFDDALRSAVGSAGAIGSTDVISGDTSVDGELIEQDPLSWAGDHSSIYLERENAALLSNSLQLNAVSDGMSRRLAMLRFAASDGNR